MADTPHVITVNVADVPEFMSILGTALSLYEALYRSPAEVVMALPQPVLRAYGDVQAAVGLWRDRGHPMPSERGGAS